MKNDSRRFLGKARLAVRGILVAIGGLVAAGFYAERMPQWVSVTVFAVGLGVGFFVFLPMAIMNTYEGRRRARLERGEGVLARWTVDADTWRRTGQRCLQAGAQRDAARNSITSYDAPASNVEVVVMEEALFIDDELHALVPSHGITVAVEDGWIGFDPWHQEGDNWMLRVPVARGAEADAERVAAHFRALMATRG